MILAEVWLQSEIVNDCNQEKLASWHADYVEEEKKRVDTSFVSKFHLNPLSYRGCQCQAASSMAVHLEGSLGDWLLWS